ncbi:MAG: U3 small nucleolar RNA-associated protein 13 [Bogoriella megaspora]|nr:MAG: U3 small nucleolar RNA-associated protein 13 [Bogoriella megaspora]
MAQTTEIKTTFDPVKTIQPFYTGGSVALSEDDQTLATSLGEDIVITNLRSGGELARVDGDGEPITTISLTPDASYLIACSRSLAVRIYSLRWSGDILVPQLQRTLKPHASPVVTSAVDGTGTLLATGGADGSIKVFDIRGGFVTHTFHGHSGVVTALHFFEVEGEEDHHKERKGRKSRKRRSNGEPMDVDEPKDGRTAGFRLASGGEDSKIRIWDLHKRKSVAKLDSHVSVVRGLDFSKEASALVSGSRDKTIMIWSARDWKVQNTIPVLEVVESVGFVANGTSIYAGGESGCVRIWSTSTGKEITEEQAVSGEAEAVVQILDMRKSDAILSVHADQSLRIQSLSPLKQLREQQTIPHLPELRRISGTYDEVIDLAYVGIEKSLLALATNLEDLRLISLSPRQTTSTQNGQQNSALDSTSYFGTDIASLRGHSDIIITLDTDWSGHWLATGAKDNTARIWRLDPVNSSYTCHAIFTGHAESIGAVALPHDTPTNSSTAHTSPLSQPPVFLITGSQDKTIKRWAVPTATSNIEQKVAKAAFTRKAHDKDINALDTNFTSTFFASASQDRTVKIWDIEAGETIGVLRGHKRGVWSVRFSPLGTSSISGEAGATSSARRGYVVTGSGDKTVRIWSLADYSCLRTLEGHTNSVLKVIWLPPPSTTTIDGQARGGLKREPQVASAAGDGLVKIWNVEEGELATTLDNHTDRVWALAVKPGSSTSNPTSSISANAENETPDEEPTTLLSGGADGVLTFWTDTTRTTHTKALAVAASRVESDTELANLIRARSFRSAITLALQLDHPARLLSIFQSVAAQRPPDEGSITGSKDVDDVVASLRDEQLWKLLLRVRDWNTSVKNAGVAQRVLNAVLRLVERERLVGLQPPRGGGMGGRKEGLKDVLDGLRAYSERHAERVEKVREEGGLVGYTLVQMDDGLGMGFMDGIRGTGDRDVEMVG